MESLQTVDGSGGPADRGWSWRACRLWMVLEGLQTVGGHWRACRLWMALGGPADCGWPWGACRLWVALESLQAVDGMHWRACRLWMAMGSLQAVGGTGEPAGCGWHALKGLQTVDSAEEPADCQPSPAVPPPELLCSRRATSSVVQAVRAPSQQGSSSAGSTMQPGVDGYQTTGT